MRVGLVSIGTKGQGRVQRRVVSIVAGKSVMTSGEEDRDVPFKIAIHNGEKHLKKQVDSI